MGMSTGKGDLNAEINVTPLVDVMLVLLVIFMVTAPMLNTGVELELPEANAKPLPEGKNETTILNLDAKGNAFIGDVAVPWDQLEEKLKFNKNVQEKGLYIAADKNLPYGRVLQAMATAQRANVSKILMMADPADLEPPVPATDTGDKKPTADEAPAGGVR